MGNFEKWAKANPKEMAEYKALQKALARIDENIGRQKQIIEDAQNGILPQRTGLSLFGGNFMSEISDTFLARMKAGVHVGEQPTTERQKQIIEDALIQKKKERHRKELQEAIEKAQRELDGFTVEFEEYKSVSKGLYVEQQEVQEALDHFLPDEHLIDWQEDIPGAIAQRLHVLGWGEGQSAGTLDELIDSVIEEAINRDYPFGFELTIVPEAYRWKARVFDAEVSFTRVDYDPLTPVQRALYAYLEYQWDKLYQFWVIDWDD